MWVVTWSQGGMRYRAVLYGWDAALAYALQRPGSRCRVISAATWHREQGR